MALSVIKSGANRRAKAFAFLICCALIGALPHFLLSFTRYIPAIIFSIFLGTHSLKVVCFSQKNNLLVVEDLELLDDESLPFVDIVVSARDEEAVIGQLVNRLTNINYPESKLSILIVNDGSEDDTGILLKQAEKEFPYLTIINRSRLEKGGKSAALNEALKNSTGEWIFVLDADADFQEDILFKLVSFAKSGDWSAIQLRKSVVNFNENLLTTCQAMEMAMDAFIQQGRLLNGGISELRGNGQFLRRDIFEQSGSFNEDTVTDDLDLSFRFLLIKGTIGLMWDPPVTEEAVDNISDLIRQRKRWAEGGLQRFFDYFGPLISSKLSYKQYYDLISFFLLQYAVPVVLLFDLITSFALRQSPIYFSISFVAFFISAIGFYRGCMKSASGPKLPYPSFLNLIFSLVYMSHWFIVIPWVAIKMALFRKKFIWVKTSHKGLIETQ